MRNLKLFFLVMLAINSNMLFGQITSENLKGNVVNALNGLPISYAHIYVRGKNQGTVSNFEGEYYLADVNTLDTLVFSFIGFESWEASVRDILSFGTVKLFPITEVLNEVMLVSNDEFLYALLAGCKKTMSRKVKIAKTYFSLNTFIDSSQVELLECYYNGSYTGYDLRKLELKNGRISLKEYNDNYFVSVSTSRALTEHRLFSKSDFFPLSPFELNKKAIEKKFFVHLDSKFIDEKQRVVYAVKYTPKANELFHFYGKAWIDSTTGNLLKVELNSDSSLVSPFSPLFPSDSLKKIAFKVSKTFELEKGQMYVKSIDFNYELLYASQRQGEYTVYSNAVLYAYAYEDKFLLPFYDVGLSSMTDYRKITSAPYNAFFWENIKEFQMEDVQKRNAKFAKKTVLISDLSNSLNGISLRKGFFENSFILWSNRRMHIKDKLPRGTVYENLDGVLPSRRYNLEAHLYLDINTLGDSTNYLVRAVYDPFKSYFHYPDSKLGDAFINMYFDLFEAEKRKLEEALYKLNDAEIQVLKAAYNSSLEDVLKTSRRYIKEVERGKDEAAMKKWNVLIHKNVGIDNLWFYQLDFGE